MSTELVPVAPVAVPSRPIIGPDALLAAFLDGRGAATLRAYDGDLKDFARFVRCSNPRAALAFLVELGHGGANLAVLEYRNHLQARKLAPATVGRRLAALRSAVKVARLIGLVDWALDVESPKAERYRDTRGPGTQGWASIRCTAEALAEQGSPQAIRDLAIVSLLRGLGLRRGELVSLDVEHVELDADPPGVWIHGKGRADRERLTLPRGVVAALEAWLAIRPGGPRSPGPVFFRLDRNSDPDRLERLSDRSIGNLVPALAHRAGLRRRVRPHGLRHEAITTLLDLTRGDVRAVQRFSRHKDLRTLTLYDDRRRDGAGELAKLLEEGKTD